jgi:nucleoside-diphosphate-sugar epimerase
MRRLPGMNEHKTVLVAGASGVFGRHIDRVLTDAGYTVIGLGRGSANAVRADINDRDQLLRAVEGQHADIVVHAATALAKPPIRQHDMVATDRLRTVGMRNLVEAAGIVGARRLISESMVFGYGYGPHGSAILTEETAQWAPVQADPRTEQHVAAMRTKEELTFHTPGLEGVALRFGLFYGPGGSDMIIDGLRKHMMPAPKSDTVVPWVHLADAAAAVRDAIERGRPGQAYNIVDDQAMNFGEHIIATAAAFGTPKPLVLPAWLLRPIGLLNEILRTDLRLSNAKARAELGWAPQYPTVADGLRAMAGATVGS